MKRQKSITRSRYREKKLGIFEKMQESRRNKKKSLKIFINQYDKIINNLFIEK